MTVNKADTQTATEIHKNPAHDPVTAVALGSTVHDRAAVSGQVGSFAIGDDVSFTFYTSGDCSTGGSDAGTVAVSGGVAHPSDDQGPLAAGAYSFKAHYNGDSNYEESTSDCEPLTVNKADTQTATEIHKNPAHDPVTAVALGSTVHDRAAVSGQVGSFAIGDDVSFTFYTSGDCSTGGSDAGTVAVSAGSPTPPTTRAPWPPAPTPSRPTTTATQTTRSRPLTASL